MVVRPPGSGAASAVAIAASLVFGSLTARAAAQAGPAGGVAAPAIQGRWACSENLRFTLHAPGAPDRELTSGHADFKPSWSPDGSQLTFFRLRAHGPQSKDWHSAICVMNADGTGFRELTTGRFPDFNPSWTRDGSKRIVFNRFSTHGGLHNQVYWTTPTAALRDGRLLVDRISESSVEAFLLTPAPGRAGRNQPIRRPTDLVWQKLSLSASERRVVYMLDQDGKIPTHQDAVLRYADFEAAALTVSNPVAITESDPRCVHEYPVWSRDESVIFYDAGVSGRYRLYACRLADGVTARVSPRADRDYQSVTLEGLPR